MGYKKVDNMGHKKRKEWEIFEISERGHYQNQFIKISKNQQYLQNKGLLYIPPLGRGGR